MFTLVLVLLSFFSLVGAEIAYYRKEDDTARILVLIWFLALYLGSLIYVWRHYSSDANRWTYAAVAMGIVTGLCIMGGRASYVSDPHDIDSGRSWDLAAALFALGAALCFVAARDGNLPGSEQPSRFPWRS